MFSKSDAFTLSTPANPVVACIDGSSRSSEIALAAFDLAMAADLPLILFHAVENSPLRENLPDPLDRHLAIQTARRMLAGLRRSLPASGSDVSVLIAEGEWPEALLDKVGRNVEFLVVGASESSALHRSSAEAARPLLSVGIGPLVIVQRGYQSRRSSKPCIAVAVDGSNFSEAALAQACKLALRRHAELVVVHAVPDASLTDFGPPDVLDLELRLRLDRRNEEAAFSFLEEVRHRLSGKGLAVRSMCIKGEPRIALLRALEQLQPDLVVLSAMGQGGRRCRDLALGSTARYLVDHLSVPVLLLQPEALASSLPGHAGAAAWAGTRSARSAITRNVA